MNTQPRDRSKRHTFETKVKIEGTGIDSIKSMSPTQTPKQRKRSQNVQ